MSGPKADKQAGREAQKHIALIAGTSLRTLSRGGYLLEAKLVR